MSNKKERKAKFEEIWNPHVLTLDQALSLAGEKSPNPETARKDNRHAVHALCDRVSCRFSGPHNISRLTFGERLARDLSRMESEVLNGSFHQYLTNSTGENGEEVKLYLKCIGAALTLGLFERLSEIFPDKVIPRDRDQRCDFVDRMTDMESPNDLFDELSVQFCNMDEDMNGLIVSYARQHRDQFVEPADEVVQTFKRMDRIREHCLGRP